MQDSNQCLHVNSSNAFKMAVDAEVLDNITFETKQQNQQQHQKTQPLTYLKNPNSPITVLTENGCFELYKSTNSPFHPPSVITTNSSCSQLSPANKNTLIVTNSSPAKLNVNKCASFVLASNSNNLILETNKFHAPSVNILSSAVGDGNENSANTTKSSTSQERSSCAEQSSIILLTQASLANLLNSTNTLTTSDGSGILGSNSNSKDKKIILNHSNHLNLSSEGRPHITQQILMIKGNLNL